MNLDYKQLIELRRMCLHSLRIDSNDVENPTSFQNGILDAIDTDLRRKAPVKKDSITYEVVDNICTVTTTFDQDEMSEDYVAYMMQRASKVLKIDDGKARISHVHEDNGMTIYTISRIPADRKVLAAEKRKQHAIDTINSLSLSQENKDILIALSIANNV